MSHARVLALLLTCLAGAVFVPAAQGSGNAPGRVASINLCTDQLLVRLLEPERIASISFLGADPHYSAVAGMAAGLPLNQGRAEEILRQDPDLVLADRFGNRAAKEMLRRLGYRVVELAPPEDLPGVRQQLLDVGELLGVPERAASLVAELDARLLESAGDKAKRQPAAVIYEPGGVTLGGGGLPHAVLEAANLANLAAERGIQGAAPFPLERLVVTEPDVLVLYGEPAEAPPSQAAAVLHHPALRGLTERVEVAVVPRELWTCGGPEVMEAIDRLVQAREAALERKEAR